MKFLLDILPLAAFFLAYQFGGNLPGYEDKRILVATGALIVATLFSLSVTYIKDRKIALNPLISGVVVTLFGGLTIALNNDTFIKMKPTIVNLLFATILLIGLAMKKPLLKYLLEVAVKLTERGWRVLTFRWAIFFIFLAGLNEFIWRTQTEEFWVNFKVFGMMPITILFMLAQWPLFKREMIEEKAPE
jgi:intracellular septation protein